MNVWKHFTAVTALCLLCLTCSPVATAQGSSAAPPSADTAAVQRIGLGKPFPYSAGVGMQLGYYRQVRRAAQLADSTIASKNARLASQQEQIIAAEMLYSMAADRADEAQRNSDRKDVTIDRLRATMGTVRRQANRPLLLRAETWQVGSFGFVVGAAVGAGVVGYLYYVR